MPDLQTEIPDLRSGRIRLNLNAVVTIVITIVTRVSVNAQMDVLMFVIIVQNVASKRDRAYVNILGQHVS